MKQPPRKISKELFLEVDYLICRFIRDEVAYKTDHDVLFTIKKIKEKGLWEQYHFHIRFKGRDKWNNLVKDIDIDFYLDEKEAEKLKKMLEDTKDIKEEK